MPKIKTNRAAAKRFRKTASGSTSAATPTVATSSRRKRPSVSVICVRRAMSVQKTQAVWTACSLTSEELKNGTS